MTARITLSPRGAQIPDNHHPFAAVLQELIGSFASLGDEISFIVEGNAGNFQIWFELKREILANFPV